MIKQLAIIAGIAGVVFSVRAQDYTTPQPAQPAPPPGNYTTPEQAQPTPPPNYYEHYNHHLYHADELSFDAYGVGSLHEHDFNNGALIRRNWRWGGGIGLNYFLTEHLGIGGDAYAISTDHSFVDTTTGNLIFRFPIEDTGLAPYIFGGAGYQFQGIDQIVGGGGVGLECRFCEHFSIFFDARFLACVKTQDYGLGRAGIRLSF